MRIDDVGQLGGISTRRKRWSTGLGRIAASTLFCLIFFVESGCANAGTTLMWAAAGHLIFGNAIIGIVEGLFLSLVFRAGVVRCILIMILANYISMLSGTLGIATIDGMAADYISVNNLLISLIVLGAISLTVTIAVEWPFCYWALKAKERRSRRAWFAAVLVNAVSYAFLVPFYLSVSNTSLVTEAKAVDVASIVKGNQAKVYFLSEHGDQLLCIRPDGSDKQKVRMLEYTMNSPRLVVCSVDGHPCLVAVWRPGDAKGSGREWKIVLDSIPGLAVSCEPCSPDFLLEWGEGADLRSGDRDWHVNCGFLAGQGLFAENWMTGEKLRLALETPLLQWTFTHATILPGDQVICQLGNQIVLLDLNSRCVALISHGVGPVVILDK